MKKSIWLLLLSLLVMPLLAACGSAASQPQTGSDTQAALEQAEAVIPTEVVVSNAPVEQAVTVSDTSSKPQFLNSFASW